MADEDGDTSYDEARRALQRRYEAAAQYGPAAQAVQLIQAVLSGTGPADACPDSGPGAGIGGVSGGLSGAAEVLAALTILRQLREEVAGWEPQLISAARDHGVSWASLAPALGVTSRQAAERRYLRLRPSSDGKSTGESTGEQRVAAERTRRAGDRAVAQWARQNSAVLRQLAGQVSALPNLTASAQRQADLVQQALADNDPSALLSPLADAHAHLKTSHFGLAEQIDAIAQHTEQLRRDTRDRRRQAQNARPGQPG